MVREAHAIWKDGPVRWRRHAFYSERGLEQQQIHLRVAHGSGGFDLTLRNARGRYFFQHVQNGRGRNDQDRDSTRPG